MIKKKKNSVGFTLISSIKLSIVNRVSLHWLCPLHVNTDAHARRKPQLLMFKKHFCIEIYFQKISLAFCWPKIVTVVKMIPSTFLYKDDRVYSQFFTDLIHILTLMSCSNISYWPKIVIVVKMMLSAFLTSKMIDFTPTFYCSQPYFNLTVMQQHSLQIL